MKLRLLPLLLLFSTIVLSQNYHDTQGKLEISNSGQASYTLPIAMPPSIKDVGPIINLTYASGQMGGIAGQGWNVSTISSISRIATRKDIDGFVDGVDFDDNDKLALDGQRLILKTGTYWADGSTYETEVQSNTSVELKGSGTAMYFIAIAPDGSRSWYGNYGGVTAVDLTAFYISRFEETNGNFMTYHYTNPFGMSLCVSEIKFSGNTQGTTAINSILFDYLPSARVETAYVKGIKHQKSALLTSIVVKSNFSPFKRYQITHSQDSQGYERVQQIQEFNRELEPANPVVFEYKTTPNSTDIIEKEYINNLNFNNIKLSGDFDGDGRLDFVANGGLYTNLFNGNGGNSPITMPNSGDSMSITTLIGNKLNQSQSLLQFQRVDNNHYQYKVFNLSGNNFVNSYSKTIELDLDKKTLPLQINTGSTAGIQCAINYNNINGTGTIIQPGGVQLDNPIEGDFDGNGISELIFMKPPNTFKPSIGSFYPNIPFDYRDCPIISVAVDSPSFYLLDLDPTKSSTLGSSGFLNISSSNHLNFAYRYVQDFNGDGKSDILLIDYSTKQYKIVEIIKTQFYSYTSLIGEGYIDQASLNKPMLFGDYNGDSKVDIMIPHAVDSYNWTIYYSNPKPTGGSFFDATDISSILYHPTQSGDTYQDWTSYYAMDINKDGKSDLVSVYKNYYKPGWTINDHDTSWRVMGYTNNFGKIPGLGFTHTYDSGLRESHSPEEPTAVTSNYRYQNLNTDLVLVRGHLNKIEYYRFNKNAAEDNLLSKVTSSAGNIVDEIEYKAMQIGTGFYSSNNSLNYPNVEINNLPTNYLVSKLKSTVGSTIKYQDFIYNGMAVNLNGLGSIGFMNTARSAWYQTPSAKRIWNVTENNPLMRGATTRSYSQLFSTGNAFMFGTTAGLINSVTNSFVETTNNSVYKILLSTQTTTDHITGVSNVVNYGYDPTYALPTSTETKNYLNGVLNGTTITTTEFENNPTGVANNYYVGRPKTSNTITSAYGDTSQSSEEFLYTNNLLTKTKKKGNTTDSKYLIEEFEYDLFGNIKKKTVSTEGYAAPLINPRTTEFTYDLTGRFIKTIKDVEGLVTTNNTYHPLYGLVTSTTNPYGLTTITEIDNWGKVKKITDYLGKSINYAYSRFATLMTVVKTGDDGSETIDHSDLLGRPTKTILKTIDNTQSYKNFQYDFLGRKISESEPYKLLETILWNTTIFDDYGRMITDTKATGLTTTITYSGTTVTGNDGYKTTSSTKNANGHVISSTDPGGTINFTYNANGTLKNSNFEGTVIAMEYNEWGAKTKLTDPSAGVYEYTYYPTGETKTEKTPKGLTTYKLDTATGKLSEKTIIGDGTDSKTTLTYHPTTKLLAQTTFQDNIENKTTTYTNTYDDKQRIIATLESNTNVSYNHEMSYDPFGRVEFEFYKSTLNALGKSSEKLIKNTYKNGAHWQILDMASGGMLWKANTVNARGQLTSANFGNGISISNVYDMYGYVREMKHDFHDDNGSGTIINKMTLNTDFNAPRGNLMSRSNNMFNWSETFTYDTLDRLTSYKNIRGEQELQAYDNKGRITQNTMGTYKYDTPSKKYQNTSVDLTPESESYYVNREGIFSEGMENLNWGTVGNYPNVTINQFISYDTTKKKSGNYAIKLTNAVAGGKYVHSDKWIAINNQNPTTYTFSGWVYTDNPTAQMVLFMKNQNETAYFTQVEHLNTTVKNQWVYISRTINIPANIKKINLRLDILGVGNVWFDDVKIVNYFDTEYQSNRDLGISYNAFKSPLVIHEHTIQHIGFAYNVNNDRSTMFYGDAQAQTNIESPLRKYYSASGNIEIKYNTLTDQVEFLTYIGGDGYSAPIVLKSDGTTQEFLYLHRDYQGSILAITNQTAQIVEKRLFDAWGNIIKVEDGAGNVLNGLTLIDRGYTGHEHLQSVGLIHMNGRLYDPKLHRFLQPDNYVQDPYNSQNYNRYGYCVNNPLKYNDPSGEVIPLLAAIGIGAFIAAATYTLTALTTDIPFTVGGIVQATFIGAFSGAVTSGIGTAATSITQFGSRIAFQAFSHGFFQGMMSGVQGGNFWTGFAAGALSSIVSSVWAGGKLAGGDGNWGGAGGEWGAKTFGTLAFGTVSGGAGAVLTGGNFWQGAATGLVVSGLNHAMHSGDSYEDVDQEDPPAKKPSLEDLKKDPPNHPDYKSPKSGDKRVNHPRGKGWIDKDGRTWIPDDHGGTHAPHWDVQPKKGPGYETKYPTSLVTPKGVVIGIGTVGAGYLVYKALVALATWECFGCGVLVTP